MLEGAENEVVSAEQMEISRLRAELARVKMERDIRGQSKLTKDGAMDYSTLKIVHQAAVALSLLGFFARGAAALAGAQWVRNRAAKTLPHIVDTVLLASALAMTWMLRLTPGNAPWLAAKILGLLMYIVLGVVALRPANSAPVRAAAWVAALVTAGWIVSVAISKNPLGFLRTLA